MKYIIDYNATIGDSFADGMVVKIVDDWIEDGSCNIVTSTGLIIDAFRAAVKQGKVSSEDIVIKFRGEELPVDSRGKLDHWPAGFHDTQDKLLTILLGWETK